MQVNEGEQHRLAVLVQAIAQLAWHGSELVWYLCLHFEKRRPRNALEGMETPRHFKARLIVILFTLIPFQVINTHILNLQKIFEKTKFVSAFNR